MEAASLEVLAARISRTNRRLAWVFFGAGVFIALLVVGYRSSLRHPDASLLYGAVTSIVVGALAGVIRAAADPSRFLVFRRLRAEPGSLVAWSLASRHYHNGSPMSVTFDFAFRDGQRVSMKFDPSHENEAARVFAALAGPGLVGPLDDRIPTRAAA